MGFRRPMHPWSLTTDSSGCALDVTRTLAGTPCANTFQRPFLFIDVTS
jgi:hypothetical protein